MEPRIQYAKTSDGVSIAYWTLGEGEPLLAPPWDVSHAQLLWQAPEARRFYESLAEGRRLVSYDARGTGLSDRDVSDFSLEAVMLDLEAVVGHVELRSFALLGIGWPGQLAIVYAARHPEQVTHLILMGSAEASYAMRTPAYQALRPLLRSDWELAAETMGHYLYGLAEGEPAQRMAAFIHESVTHRTYRTMMSQRQHIDVSDILPQVKSPTLVIQPSKHPIATLEAGRRLASRIPNARLVVVEGQNVHYGGALETVIAAINDFLSEDEEVVSATRQPTGDDIHTVLFTDIEGSTALTERLGDARAQELRRAHDAIVREALKGCSGSETKHTGDGIMASFPSASRAIECAVAVQRAIAERGDTTLRVRIGLNAGEPVAEESDLFGTAVNLARRICDKAEPGQILVSDVVHQLAAGKGFTFADNGEAALKGFEKPVRLHEVRWRDD